jgi:hypothetical protein
MKAGLDDAASAYRKLSRYFFYAFLVLGLAGTVSDAFEQNSNQQPQLTLTLSNVKVFSGPVYQFSITTASGTVNVQGPWNGGPLHFSGWIAVTDNMGVINGSISGSNFTPASLPYPSSTNANFSYTGQGRDQMISYTIVINAYDQNGQLVGTTGGLTKTKNFSPRGAPL